MGRRSGTDRGPRGKGDVQSQGERRCRPRSRGACPRAVECCVLVPCAPAPCAAPARAVIALQSRWEHLQQAPGQDDLSAQNDDAARLLQVCRRRARLSPAPCLRTQRGGVAPRGSRAPFCAASLGACLPCRRGVRSCVLNRMPSSRPEHAYPERLLPAHAWSDCAVHHTRSTIRSAVHEQSEQRQQRSRGGECPQLQGGGAPGAARGVLCHLPGDKPEEPQGCGACTRQPGTLRAPRSLPPTLASPSHSHTSLSKWSPPPLPAAA